MAQACRGKGKTRKQKQEELGVTRFPVMVDHAEGGACEVLSQTASPITMPWASSDQVQGIHTAVAELTADVAPCTPMQLSVAWKKPQTHETPESSQSLPSLSLGRGSSERHKGGMVMPNSQQSPLQQQMPSRSRQAGALTPFKSYSRIQLEVQREGPELHKENLLSLSSAKHEKQYRAGQKPDLAMPLGHHTGHLPLHRAPAMPGLSNMLPSEMLTSPQAQSPQHKEALYTGFTVLPDKSFLLSPNLAEKVSSIPALSGSCESGSNDSKLTSELGISSTLYSPVPGEEANNAYKLYSEMFPPTCTAMSAYTTSPPLHAEQGLCLSNPMLAEHVDVMQLLPGALYQQQLIPSGKGNHVDDRTDSGKRLKYTSVKDNNTSCSLIDVKKEQASEQRSASFCVVDATNSCAAQNFPSHMDTRDMCSLNSTWKECVDLGGDYSHKDCMAKKHSLEQTQSHSTTLRSPKRSKANSVSLSLDVGGYSASATSLKAEVVNAQPPVGLKLFTTSAYAQMPKALLTFSSGEPSLPLSLEPSQKLPNIGLGKAPVHGSSSMDADWGKFLALSATPVGNAAESESASKLPFQQRFKQLQAFLKQCDEADQNECMQALRSLSAAARSGHAVELETRAIRLSLEEGTEMKRMRLLNVLGRISERSLDDAGATPHGPRLPAPGATSKLKHVT